VSAYNLGPRVRLTDDGYAVTCFDGSVGRVRINDAEGVVLVFEDGSTERYETADRAISTLIGGPQR
jgi:hypothetical protein